MCLRPVQGEPCLLPNDSWDRLQPPTTLNQFRQVYKMDVIIKHKTECRGKEKDETKNIYIYFFFLLQL